MDQTEESGPSKGMSISGDSNQPICSNPGKKLEKQGTQVNAPWNNKVIRPSRNQTRSQEGRPPGGPPLHHYQSSGLGRQQPRTRAHENKPPGKQNEFAGENQNFSGPSVGHKANSSSDTIRVIKKDLFEMSSDHALAHCVGSDIIMSSGIAVNFRKKFRCIPELLDQNRNPGEVAFLRREDTGQYVYYLVTKLCSTGKPIWEDFVKAVTEWKDLCVRHGVKKIAIPQIGCGRDRLNWETVQSLLKETFSDTGIEITVCQIDRESTPPMKWNIKMENFNGPLSKLDSRGCALVFMASRDRFVTRTIDRLCKAYGFESDYKSTQLGLGELFSHYNKIRDASIFGLVVKNRHDDQVSFTAIGKGLQKLRKEMKNYNLWFMGIEAFDDPYFPIVTRKVGTVVIDVFFTEKIEVFFCWPEEVKESPWF